MRKRIIMLMLSLSLATTCFIACGSDDDNKKSSSSKNRDEDKDKEDNDDDDDDDKDNGDDDGDAKDNDKNRSNGEGEEEPHAPEIGIACMYYESGTYDSEWDTFDYEYNIPEIVGANTDYINRVNSELAEMKIEAKECVDTMAEGDFVDLIDISFTMGSGDCGTSIAVKKEYMYNDYSETYCYTYDSYGNEVSTKDFIDDLGISEDELCNKIKNDLYDELYSNFVDENGDFYDGVEYCLEETNNHLNLDNIKIYYNEDGKLTYLIVAIVPAGAGAYDFIHAL